MDTIFLNLVTNKNLTLLRDYFKAFYIEGKVIEGKLPSASMDEKLFEKDFAFFCQEILENSEKKQTEEGVVWISYYLAYRSVDQKVIGMGEIRHELLGDLQASVGNIGYSVMEQERRKGYGKQILMGLIKQGKIWGMESFHIASYEDNIASNKIILSCGGKLLQKRKDTEGNICYYKLLL